MKEPINIEEWTVHRSRHDRRRVWVLLGEGVSAAPWLARLRRLLPELEERTPVDLLAEVRESGRIELGWMMVREGGRMMPGREAHAIGAKLRENGYEVMEVDASVVSHSAIRSVKGALSTVLIEDDEMSERFCLDLIARGARVVEAESEG